MARDGHAGYACVGTPGKHTIHRDALALRYRREFRTRRDGQQQESEQKRQEQGVPARCYGGKLYGVVVALIEFLWLMDVVSN